MANRQKLKNTVIYAFISLLPSLISANEQLTIRVTDQHNTAVENAVITAFPQSEHLPFNLVNKKIVIDQIDKEFIGHVTTIQVGTAVEFPNHDKIHHHVYSFSSAKTFDIPLYKGSPDNLILFNKAGVVSLGCNIHDWMSAYIKVVDTPYFSNTNKKGLALLELPPGNYQIEFWHPNINNGEQLNKLVEIVPQPQQISAQLQLKTSWTPRRGPLSFFNRGKYP